MFNKQRLFDHYALEPLRECVRKQQGGCDGLFEKAQLSFNQMTKHDVTLAGTHFQYPVENIPVTLNLDR